MTQPSILIKNGNTYALYNNDLHWIFGRDVRSNLIGSLLARHIIDGDIAPLLGKLVGNECTQSSINLELAWTTHGTVSEVQ